MFRRPQPELDPPLQIIPMRLLLRLAALLPIALAAALPLSAQVRIEAAPPTPSSAAPLWKWDAVFRAYARVPRGQAPVPQQVSAADAEAAMRRYNQCFPGQRRDPNLQCQIPPLGRCTVAVEGPDSVAVVTPVGGTFKQMLIWVPRGGGGVWWQQAYPPGADTLRARFVDAFCYNAHGSDDPRGKVAYFVVERDGLFLGISHLDVWEPKPNPEWWERRPESVFVIVPGGDLDLALTARACDAENRCTQRLSALGAEQKAAGEAVRQSVEQLRDLLARQGYPEKAISLVLEGQVAVGMDTVLVRAAWGEPERVTRTQSTMGTHEVWHYERATVFLTNGRVESVSQTR